MADFVHRTTVELAVSKNEFDHPAIDWIRNPDLSLLLGIVPWKYWKVVGDTVVEMSQLEKDTVEAAIAAAELTSLHKTVKDKIVTGDTRVTSTNISDYVGDNPVWTDPISGIKGPPDIMQALVNRRELFGDTENTVSPSGYAGAVNNRVANLENIHNGGWHQQQVVASLYKAPKNLLIYYGWLNSFNSAVNGWNNEKVAQDMCKHDVIVFGDGIADSGHGDYANTQVIIARIKVLKPSILIFGYIDAAQTQNDFEDEVDDWEALAVHGIFMDQAGYDYGTIATNSRTAFNAKVDYVHAQTDAKLCFVNAWNMDHIIGIVNDPSYPNTTWNASEVASSLNTNDWYLLESYPINDSAYTASNPDGYEPKSDWAVRGVKAIGHRYEYGINLASVGIIANANAIGQDLFDFLFISALMFSLEAVGSSDTSYGSSSAAVEFWDRENVSTLPSLWSLNPSVQADIEDTDVYWRFLEGGNLMLDFSDGAQLATVTRNSIILTI